MASLFLCSAALQELPWMAEEGAAAAAAVADPSSAAATAHAPVPAPRRGSDSGDSSAGDSDALLKRGGHTVVEIEMGETPQSRVAGKGSSPGTPV